jgi:sigma-B regulation protein RsbU (phosphoserine phosphatase)
MGKILVIDDDLMIRKLMEKILVKEGHEVYLAETGRSGFEMIKSKLPDLIILDLMLPDENGLDLLKTVKSIPETKMIPVIVLTGSSQVDDKLIALKSGAVDYISKPFLSEEVKLRVQTQLKIYNLIDSLRKALLNIEDDLIAAEQIQRALVPAFPPEKLNMYWLYKLSSKVGGDIFDAIYLGEDRYFIYLIDVCGHGVNAAMLSVMINRYMNRYIQNLNTSFIDFEDLAKGLDSEFNFDKFELFFTAVFCIIDYKNNEIVISNAGHCYPIYLTNDSCEIIKRPLEGIIGISGYSGKVTKFDIADNSRLFLYTDGLTETFGVDGVPYGVEKLKKIIYDTKNLTVKDQIDSIYRDLVKFRDNDLFEDDLTFIGLDFSKGV